MNAISRANELETARRNKSNTRRALMDWQVIRVLLPLWISDEIEFMSINLLRLVSSGN